jgi:rhodanese-related sulfurtransferase
MVQTNIKINGFLYRVFQKFCKIYLEFGFLKMIKFYVVYEIPRGLGIPNLRLSKVTPLIYAGYRISKLGQIMLKLSGFQYSLDCRFNKDDFDEGLSLKYHLNPAKKYNSHNELYYHGALFIREAIGKNKKIYVHCSTGVHKAPSVVAAYFIIMGYRVNDAIKKVCQSNNNFEFGNYRLDELKVYKDSIFYFDKYLAKREKVHQDGRKEGKEEKEEGNVGISE